MDLLEGGAMNPGMITESFEEFSGEFRGEDIGGFHQRQY
jgi:hypothetical protein